MSQIEGTQVVVKLTSNPEILAQLRKNRALKKNEKGEEVFIGQFNSQPFTFTPGTRMTLGKSVASALIREATVILGDQLTGELVSAIEKVTEYEAGKGVDANVCPHCGADFLKPSLLGHHLLGRCPELKARGEYGKERERVTEVTMPDDSNNAEAEVEE